MNKQKYTNLTNIIKESSVLIIDDNKVWNHNLQFDRVNEYVNGDLHDFFDLVADEELFQIINKKFDVIFIGEVFHVINLQTIVYNLEHAINCLKPKGIIQIAINENSIDTAKTESSKIISRLEKLKNFKCIEKTSYSDENNLTWTMLSLQLEDQKQLSDDSFQTTLKIGKQLCMFANTGKSIAKIKAGLLKSACGLDTEEFKASFTTNEEVLSLYLQSEILDLNPNFNKKYLLDLSDYIFSNRNALKQLKSLNLIKQGSFNIAFDQYTKSCINVNQEYVASYAETVELIWNRCIKQKLDSTSLEQINELN